MLRRMTTLYISSHVRFIQVPSDSAGSIEASRDNPSDGGGNSHSHREGSTTMAIVLPYLLYKYSKDFERWKVQYDTPFSLNSSSKHSNVSTDTSTTTDARENSPSKAIPIRELQRVNYVEGVAAGSFPRSVSGKFSPSSSTHWDTAELQQRKNNLQVNETRRIITSSGSPSKTTSDMNAMMKDDSEGMVGSGAVTGDYGSTGTTIDKSPTLGLWGESEMFRLCSLLSHNLEIKDRKYMLKVYNQSFLGRYCVLCIVLSI